MFASACVRVCVGGWGGRLLTVAVESKAHVHQSFGWREVFRLVALEETDSQVLHQAEEDLLWDSLVVDALPARELWTQEGQRSIK